MTIVDFVAANGFSVPPLFMIPDELLNCATMDQCSITGITKPVASKVFMNSNIFIKWLDHFSSNVPGHVNWPIVLFYCGYSRYDSIDIVEKSIKLIIILVLLTSNYTHLIHPLGISVLKASKTDLKHQMEKLMIKNSCTSFTKKGRHCNSIYRV